MSYLNLTEEDVQVQRTLLFIYRAALDKLPEGRLHCKKKRNTLQYYRWDAEEKKQIYIPQKNHDLVFELKYRRMLEEAIATIEANLKVQEKILRTYKPYDPASLMGRLGDVYQDMPLLLYHPEFQAPSKNEMESYQLKKWEEERIHMSSFGAKFRSKSEAVIGELLHVTKIPFFIEPKLILKDEYGREKIYYPDYGFEPPARDELYWEHLGRMDLQRYRERSFEKLATYHYNNILPPNNLIITMDDKNGGLDIAGINRVITGQLMPLFYGPNGKPLF